MIIFIVMLMAVVAIGFIIYPLLKQRIGIEAQVENEALQELSSKRDTTYAMLKEVEFDFQSGILVEEDYRTLEDRYKQKAVSILKEIHAFNEAEDATEREIREMREGKKKTAAIYESDDIEKEILRIRKGKNGLAADNSDKSVEEEIKNLRKNRTQAATSENDAREHEAKNYDYSTTVRSGFCTQCGTKAETRDRFCARCGTELRLEEAIN